MTLEKLLAIFSLGLMMFQVPATLILLSRLVKGSIRLPPLKPRKATPDMLGKVSVIVPTLNERERLGPCLRGLGEQGYEVREILFIDSYSQDGTIELIKEEAKSDPRFRLLHDDPLPAGWVGRPWALNYGFLHTEPESEWVLGIDADTQPQLGLIPSLLEAASQGDYDLLSISPQFILEEAGEWLLQPSLLITLLYRFESAGVKNQSFPEQVMANGQCFLSRRSVLEALGGYNIAAGSFCDDVTLARYAATRGYKVGFLDGSSLLKVRMYKDVKDTWSGWGRSLDLKDATSSAGLWGDLALLFLVQGIPLVMTLFLSAATFLGYSFLSLKLALALNLFLVVIRFALCLAIYPSYFHANKPQERLFWLSPLLDPLAVVRIFLSALTKPKQWRGRAY